MHLQPTLATLSANGDREQTQGRGTAIGFSRAMQGSEILNAQKHAAPHVGIGLLLTGIGGLLYTLDLPLLRLAESEHWTLVFARGLFPFLALSVGWVIARVWRGSDVPFVAGWAGVGVIATNAVSNMSFVGALTTTNAANVVFIFALVPMLTAIFSRIFLGEKIHGFTWAAALTTLFGVTLIVFDGLNLGSVLGDLLAFLCACCTALTFTIIRASGKNLATSLGVGSLISSLIALAFFGADLEQLLQTAKFGMPGLFWVALNGLAVIPVSAALLANGPRFLPSTDVSMFFLLETILTPIWIWLLFGEVPTRMVTLGGLLIISTLLLHSLWRLRVTFNPAIPEIISH